MRLGAWALAHANDLVQDKTLMALKASKNQSAKQSATTMLAIQPAPPGLRAEETCVARAGALEYRRCACHT